MKKRIVLLIALSLFAVTVLSSWEGAAATAPEGELPATGFYVATNSFPQNTVVDVTCLETNKTTRAIVANGLDNPGLLAVISREAAELIGMRRGSVSTVRMIQPTDPVAYSRFAEGAASGTPYYNSGDVLTEELYREDTYKPPVTAKEVPVNGTGPSYVLEPEWRTRGAAPYIPGTPADYTVGPVQAEKKEEPPVIVKPVPEEKVEETPVYTAEPVPEEKVEETPVYVAEPVPEEKVKETVVEPERIAEVYTPSNEFILTPAEKRPPENTIYGIDPAYIIPGITVAPSAKEPEKPVLPPVVDGTFSVPSIIRLDSGKYYVQIASYDRPESVENELRHIDHSYKPVVYKANDAVYRILLGPLNQGESAAVLQRFKSIGYKDAFIRHEK